MKRGDTLDDLEAGLRIGQITFGARRPNKSRGDRVYGDVVPSPLDGKTFGEVRDGRFGHAINGFSGQCDESSLRTHIDDAAVILPDHDTSGSLTGEEGTFQIDGEGRIEVFLADILGRIFR